MASEPIYVTKPVLPDINDFKSQIDPIWASGRLTNSGRFASELTVELCRTLGVKHGAVLANGTLGLMLVLRALDIVGEVITTPYSFIATSHSILWNGNTPVFVDIDPNTLNLDPIKIEAAISPQTQAILPVHTYGIPCDDVAIAQVAAKNNLKLIYDCASSYGVTLGKKSIFQFGDASVLSLHATKVINTLEGGAVFSSSLETIEKIENLRNFGIENETTIPHTGLNAKLSELHALFGLAQLQSFESDTSRRKELDEEYRNLLADVTGISCITYPTEMMPNYGYFPIFVEQDYPINRDQLYTKLAEQNIHCRRYYYPLISEHQMYSNLPSSHCDNLPVAHETSRRILCLPIYPDLSIDIVREISQRIANVV